MSLSLLPHLFELREESTLIIRHVRSEITLLELDLRTACYRKPVILVYMDIFLTKTHNRRPLFTHVATLNK